MNNSLEMVILRTALVVPLKTKALPDHHCAMMTEIETIEGGQKDVSSMEGTIKKGLPGKLTPNSSSPKFQDRSCMVSPLENRKG